MAWSGTKKSNLLYWFVQFPRKVLNINHRFTFHIKLNPPTFFSEHPKAKAIFTFLDSKGSVLDQKIITQDKQKKFLYVHTSSSPFIRICFHSVDTDLSFRLSFFYTNKQDVLDEDAKKNTVEALEKNINRFMKSLNKLDKQAVESTNREVSSFQTLGRKINWKTIIWFLYINWILEK